MVRILNRLDLCALRNCTGNLWLLSGPLIPAGAGVLANYGGRLSQRSFAE